MQYAKMWWHVTFGNGARFNLFIDTPVTRLEAVKRLLALACGDYGSDLYTRNDIDRVWCSAVEGPIYKDVGGF